MIDSSPRWRTTVMLRGIVIPGPIVKPPTMTNTSGKTSVNGPWGKAGGSSVDAVIALP